MSEAPFRHDVELVWDTQCRLAESPTWDPISKRIFFVDQDGGRILAYGVQSGRRESWTLPDRIGSLGLCTSGRLVVAMHRKIVYFEPGSGQIETIVDDIDEPSGNRFNDGKVGPDGAFWVGTRDRRLDEGPIVDGSGRLYRVTSAGEIACKGVGYVISNGLAWSPDGGRMYHADSVKGQIDVWDFDARSGAAANRRPFATVSATEGLPDGADCDVDGCYWSAAPSAGRVNRFSTSGEIVGQIDVPCEAPTMVCFADDSMYITSMRQKPGMPNTGQKFDGGGLFRLRAPAVGLGGNRFADA